MKATSSKQEVKASCKLRACLTRPVFYIYCYVKTIIRVFLVNKSHMNLQHIWQTLPQKAAPQTVSKFYCLLSKS